MVRQEQVSAKVSVMLGIMHFSAHYNQSGVQTQQPQGRWRGKVAQKRECRIHPAPSGRTGTLPGKTATLTK